MGEISTEAFDLIINKVNECLSKKGFDKVITEQYKKVEFNSDNVIYSINFDGKIYELKMYKVINGIRDEKSLSISKWLFDKDSDTLKEAEQIAEDFYHSVSPDEVKKPKVREIRKRDKDDNVDVLFFINRLINIFPELKEKLQEERANYEEFRSVTFTRENVAPVINKFLSDKPDKTRLKKLGNVLSDMYDNGNVDVRGLITIVILSSIKEEYSGVLRNSITEELNKMWNEANNIKGKKIKPESNKKKKSFIAETLAQM